MTPFPPSDELAFLLKGDAWITQININTYAVAFVLANGCQIDAALTVIYTSPDGISTEYEKAWRDEQPLRFHNLLEKKLLTVSTSELEMTLGFEGGHQLIIITDLQPYEAGAVLSPDGTGFYF